jgi:hypothetical protein
MRAIFSIHRTSMSSLQTFQNGVLKKFKMVVLQVKCWEDLSLTLGSVANKRLPEGDNTGIQRCIFGCSNSCMLSGENVTVQYEYQNQVNFRNGRIVIG